VTSGEGGDAEHVLISSPAGVVSLFSDVAVIIFKILSHLFVVDLELGDALALEEAGLRGFFSKVPLVFTIVDWARVLLEPSHHLIWAQN
jgi:hypothetical protein